MNEFPPGSVDGPFLLELLYWPFEPDVQRQAPRGVFFEAHQRLLMCVFVPGYYRLIYGSCITGLETGVKLVAGWYYLEYLPDW